MQSVVRHSGDERCPTFTHASIQKMQSVTEIQQTRAIRTMPIETALLEDRSKLKKDTLQTHPIKKGDEDNLVGRARNDVIDQLPICLYFVIFTALVFPANFR